MTDSELRAGLTGAGECRSCGIPLTEHPGLYGTCEALQECLAQLERYEQAGDSPEKVLALLPDTIKLLSQLKGAAA